MYKVHRGANLLDIEIDTDKIGAEDDRQVDRIYALASEKDGVISVNLVNTSMTEESRVTLELPAGCTYAGGQILEGETPDTYNSVENPDAIVSRDAAEPQAGADGTWEAVLPAASVTVYRFNK
jgi:alpha-L-arabinofuranosidase